ncbi:hypothetical protein L6164_008449 [Bauhinia variegata]|uniref:Uncharacterized protein n=1 Tax=Bauhinia variegata TaxID=167791 RepID=A0ACB9PHX7_BAUVA|nr:hypothetical protein L6164_008449 [Bauhinia variegata]
MNANETLFDAITTLKETKNSMTYEVCLHVPPYIVSDGIWGNHVDSWSPMKSSVPVFEFQMIVIFVITQLGHLILKRLGFPHLVSQMIAGLILGPSLQLGKLNKYKKKMFPYGSEDTLATISSLGYAIFMFLAGAQMDFGMINKTGRRAWAIAFIGLATPLVTGFSASAYLLEQLIKVIGKQAHNVHVVFISHSITSFPVIANLLNNLKIPNSELGRLALSSALVSDILSTSVTSVGTGIVSRLHNPKMILVNMASLFAFAVLIPLICRPAMFWVIKRTPEGRPVRDVYIYAIIAMIFGMGSLSMQLDQEFSLGAFIFGLAVPEGPPLGSALVKKLELFGTWFLLPIFVTTCVMKVDLSLKFTPSSILIIGAYILMAHLIKIVACLLPPLCCKMSIKDALALALILSCKGVVEVCSYNALYDKKNIHAQTYGMLMISIMIIASIVPMCVKYLYDPSRKYTGYLRRNVMSIKPNSETRILCCIHKPYQIAHVTDFVSVCCPTAENPIIMDALHLVELVGRSSPIFVSHRLQRTVTSGSFNSYSQKLILAFDLYQLDNLGVTSINTYTAVSPTALMHEDVCHLALDKMSSIIVLPFHQKWSNNGEIEDEDKNTRALNCKVLERAPCSVAILVSRAAIPRDSTCRLAMIFLGGNDDREALVLAKRATKDLRINVVVYHFVTSVDNKVSGDWESVLDREVLKDFERAQFGPNVSYRKVVVEGGPEMTNILGTMAMEHDFFMVGRRHDTGFPQIAGLGAWSEFSELGVVGDLLASRDFQSKASVLVVQQQLVSN